MREKEEREGVEKGGRKGGRSTKKDIHKEDQVGTKSIPESSKRLASVTDANRTFMTALLEGSVQHREGKEPMEVDGGVICEDVVVWEVEIEAEVVSKLNGSFVGYLSEHKDHFNIQQKFQMDGYSNIRIIPLGYLQVLISSDVVGEVQDVVGSVGWWCNWFDRFEAWSPELVTNHRVVWLSCFGIPLHAWGDAIFRTIGFKYGTFIQVDNPTKNLLRGDRARIKIVTSLKEVVDSTVCVSVMGKKFNIRVMEEVGHSEDGRSTPLKRSVPEFEDHSQDGSEAGGLVATAAEGFSEEGSDGDWSENGQLVQKVEGQQRRQGCVTYPRKEGDVFLEESEVDPNFLGNTFAGGTPNVNNSLVDIGNQEFESCRALVVVPDVREGLLENVIHAECLADKVDGGSTEPRAQGLGGNKVSDPVPLGVEKVIGPHCYQPLVLRTKDGDFPICCNLGGVDGNCSEVNKRASLGLCSSDPLGQLAQEEVEVCRSLPSGIIHPPVDKEKGGKIKRAMRKTNPYLPYNKFYKFQDRLNRKVGGTTKKKSNKRGIEIDQGVSSEESDPIQATVQGNRMNICDMEGIGLEVVLSQEPVEAQKSSPSVVQCSLVTKGGWGDSGMAELIGSSVQINQNQRNSRALVDKDIGDAHHIIDIQEDIGLKFNGRGDEDVSRRLGSRVKRRKICELVRRENIDFLAIQETKMEAFSDFFVDNLWGISACGWASFPAVGAVSTIAW
ncbi:hypothetical protein P8452_71443 [Trifolium repens]|nr:hypothetical protein P8452_71443 [Trifolium repens]